MATLPQALTQAKGDPGMRSFKSAFSYPFLRKYQDGVMTYRYRGIECLRSPIDAAIQAHESQMEKRISWVTQLLGGTGQCGRVCS